MTHRCSTGETALWRAVIAQAIHDATLGRHRPGARRRRRPTPRPLSAERRRQRDTARDWLLGGGHDFRRVCLLADLDPLAVRAVAIDAIANADDGTMLTAPMPFANASDRMQPTVINTAL